jgi:hypothetical protein
MTSDRQVLDQRIARGRGGAARHHDDAVGAGLFGIQRLRRHGHPHRQAPAVGAHKIADAVLVYPGLDRGILARAVIEFDQVAERTAAHLFGGIAGELFAGPVPARDCAAGIRHEDRERQWGEVQFVLLIQATWENK